MSDTQVLMLWAILVMLALCVAFSKRAIPDDQLPEPEMLDWSGVNRRRRDAKRFNEHAKLFATFLNNLGIAFVVTAAIAPAIQRSGPIDWPRTFLALLAAGVLHMFGQLSLRAWKSEE